MEKRAGGEVKRAERRRRRIPREMRASLGTYYGNEEREGNTKTYSPDRKEAPDTRPI